jgi:hypothetical protein
MASIEKPDAFFSSVSETRRRSSKSASRYDFSFFFNLLSKLAVLQH